MIRFMDLPAQESAVDMMVDHMQATGFSKEEAEVLCTKAGAIALAALRQLDKPILDAVTDESDRTLIQQMVMRHMIGCLQQCLMANAMQTTIEMFNRMGVNGNG